MLLVFRSTLRIMIEANRWKSFSANTTSVSKTYLIEQARGNGENVDISLGFDANHIFRPVPRLQRAPREPKGKSAQVDGSAVQAPTRN